MRNRFDNQLAEMNNELISMGALCENAIASAVKALLEGDIKLAAAAIRIDQEIDRKEREIESMVPQAAAAAAAGCKRSASDLVRAENDHGYRAYR